MDASNIFLLREEVFYICTQGIFYQPPAACAYKAVQKVLAVLHDSKIAGVPHFKKCRSNPSKPLWRVNDDVLLEGHSTKRVARRGSSSRKKERAAEQESPNRARNASELGKGNSPGSRRRRNSNSNSSAVQGKGGERARTNVTLVLRARPTLSEMFYPSYDVTVRRESVGEKVSLHTPLCSSPHIVWVMR